MWQDKKFIVIVGLLAAILVLGSTLGGIALARQSSSNTPQVRIAQPNISDKTFTQDRTGTMTEILDKFLQKLVDEGKITREEAEQFKSWLDARPDIPSDEFKQWLESRPDMPCLFSQSDEGGKKLFGIISKGDSKFGFGFGYSSN